MNANNHLCEKNKKVTRVYVDGCFDLVHYGHANALRQARALGDYLIAGVHSDEEIKAHKGPPVFTEDERYRLVKAIKWVDEVIMGAPYSASIALLDRYNCDFIAHGDDVPIDSSGSDPYSAVKTAVGRYREFKRTEGISTTDLVSRILSRIHRSSMSHAAVHSRRSHSADSSLVPNDLGTSQKITVNSNKLDSTFRPSDRPHFSWTDGGMSYMPNTLRITQFCSGTFSAYGPREPSPDDVVLYLPGSFDLFHIGHLSFFEKCLELGNYLLVGLHSDSNATYENQRLGAILTLQERILSVLACRYVCNVVIDAPYVVPASMLDHFKVSYVVVGKDTKLALAPDGTDPMMVPKQRGILRRIDSGCSVTTSSVIARILNHRTEYEKRNRLKENNEAQVLSGFCADAMCTEFTSRD